MSAVNATTSKPWRERTGDERLAALSLANASLLEGWAGSPDDAVIDHDGVDLVRAAVEEVDRLLVAVEDLRELSGYSSPDAEDFDRLMKHVRSIRTCLRTTLACHVEGDLEGRAER